MPARAQRNLLSHEALAAARRLTAEICLAEGDNNDPLRAAATERGIAVRTVSG